MFDSVFLNTALLLLGILFLTLYFYVKNLYSYWKNHGVPYLEPTFPFGNMGRTFRQQDSIMDALIDVYNQTDEPVIGIYSLFQPQLIVRDPELIRNILVKDFSHFTDRGVYVDEKNDPMSAHLFALGGDQWKNLRVKLTPTFTSGKMKAMFPTLLDCTHSLLHYIDQTAQTNVSFDAREMAGCFTTNVIASVAFGADIDCFAEPENPFRKYGRKIFAPTLKNGFRLLCFAMCPEVLKWSPLHFTDADVEEFMFDMVQQMLELREKKNIVRKDFFQLLVQLRNTGNVQLDDEWHTNIAHENSKKLSIEQMVAQAFIFYLAGFETTSSSISFCLYEIAKNPDIQHRLHAEIDDVLMKHGGQFTYESINDLKYLEACFNETLRKYPPVPGLSRKCTKDYKIPGMDITIEKGTAIALPTIAYHYDPKYYPQPEKFDPMRFVGEEKKSGRLFLPFGDGPRNCVGLRMGRINAIVGLASMLQKYHFDLDERHIGKEMKFLPATITLHPVDGIHLKVRPRMSSL